MPTASIQFAASDVRVRGDGLPAIRNALTVRDNQVTVERGNVNLTRSERPFYTQSGPDELLIPMPLISRAIDVLTQHGIQVRREGIPRWPHLSAADNEWADRVGVPVEQRLLAAALLNAPCGQIAYCTRTSQRNAFATLIRSFPQLSILIVSARRQELDGLAGDLTRRSGVRVYSDPRAAFEHTPTVLVTTRFNFGAVNSDDWDIVVFTDPSALLSCEAINTATWLARHETAFYCLRPASLLLTSVEELEVESFCGPVIYTCTAVRGRLANVSVIFAEGIARPLDNASDANAGALACKREQYWQNGARNRLIASLVSALKRRDRLALERHGIRGADNEESLLSRLLTTEPSITLLVESREHAESLQQHLPAWPLITAAVDAQRHQTLPRRFQRAIITETTAAEHEITSDVLIVASGSVPAWDRLRFPRAIESEVEQEDQLLIDFADEFTANAVNCTNSRLNAYETRRWPLIQAPTFITSLARSG